MTNNNCGRRIGFSLLLSLCCVYMSLTGCKEGTDLLGADIMPSEDFVNYESKTYGVTTTSYEVGDHVLSRTTTSCFGRFTDPETNTVVESDFLAQFHCSESFGFPTTVIGDNITNTYIRLFIDGYVGDSLAPFKLSVYPLDKVMDANADYYTDIIPENYYDETQEPMAVKWFTISDRSLTDSERQKTQRHVDVPLAKEVGQTIYEAYRSNPEHFRNTQTWLNSGLPGSKGFYFKLESGDGAMAYISVAQFNMSFRYHDAELSADTAGVCQFAMTSEVVQATRFNNSRLDQLVADNPSVTFLKSPAGIFTLATLPTDQISMTDTINSASLTLRRYNNVVLNSKFKLDIPKTILMVRLDDYLNGFFENYSLIDKKTSFLTTFNAASNTYQFGNIARLLTTIQQEKNSGKATANADKVLLIPVVATYDSSGNLVRLNHDFSMTSATLMGGTTSPVELKVIYSNYNH